jgi:hypothetical protein
MINVSIIKQNTGNYIRFGGKGILDGLTRKKCKVDSHKIIKINNEELTVQRYHSRKKSFLQAHNYNQDYEIITAKEFRLLPVY